MSLDVVAIDGPAGAGKSTVAMAVARRLGWRYIDTGAMYRAVALAALEAGIDPAAEGAVAGVARTLPLDGAPAAARLRAPDVAQAASVVARHPSVRRELVTRQRVEAERGAVVIEGRDIGTVVAPDATVKVFLTAALDERARRRALDLGVGAREVAGVRAAMSARDDADTSRDTSPLAAAPDAVAIDTTGRSIEEVVEQIVALVAAR